MTEGEWQDTTTDWAAMFRFINKKASARKLRLLACAACQLVQDRLDDTSLRAVSLARDFADGASSKDELKSAFLEVKSLLKKLEKRDDRDVCAEAAALAACYCASYDIRNGACVAASNASNCLAMATRYRDSASGSKAICCLLRDVVDPFHKIPPKQQWLTEEVVLSTRQIYSSADFTALPEIAGLLKKSDCTDDRLVQHLLSPGPHVRGCWAVDMILRLK